MLKRRLLGSASLPLEFWHDGHGLEVKEKAPCCAYLEGGGGGIRVTACVEGKQTSVEMESREWDFQVKEFIGKIH